MELNGIKVNSRVFLAPLAGYTNKVYRKIMVEFGAGFVTTEMVSDKALCFDSKKTLELLDIDDNEHPCAIQLFGADIEDLVKATKILNKIGNHDVLDINMGCPVPKVIKAKAGSYWLLDLNESYKKVKAIVEASEKPVTAKIRIGYTKENINAIETAKMLEKAGVKLICVHGRCRSDFYSGNVDMEIIKKVKESVNIPVVANGDIVSVKKAIEMFEYTKCDAISIGRGSLGNPWLFKQINHYLETKTLLNDPTPLERIEMCLKHAKLLIELKGEKVGIMEMRSLACFYVKGIPMATKLKEKINKINYYQDLENVLYNHLKELGE